VEQQGSELQRHSHEERKGNGMVRKYGMEYENHTGEAK
jgi:hypothetical protein